jgi:hypothetical protein
MNKFNASALSGGDIAPQRAMNTPFAPRYFLRTVFRVPFAVVNWQRRTGII